MKKLICIVLSLLLLSACSFSEKVTDDPERTGGRFRDYTTAPLSTLNMYATSDTVSINLSRLCTVRLYTKLINQDGDGYFYAPDLALSSPVSISDDNTVWQISLRKDCRWANGEIITAQDEICRENDFFVMLTEIATELEKQPEMMNPRVNGHFGAKGLEVIGADAGAALGRLRMQSK